jgi:hypothetical protein
MAIAVHRMLATLRTSSARDRRILELALRKIDPSSPFADHVRALREAVEETIPAGRVFCLGHTEHGPIAGSLISGVGIADSPFGVRIVRVRDGAIDDR